MALHDLQIRQIKNTVGVLCEKKTMPEFKDQLTFDFEIKNQSVIIQEIRPYWQDASQTIYHDIAKLTYVKTSEEWILFWKRASGKWQKYEPAEQKHKLEELVQEIESDKHGCFFG
jgi:hypothetical protein